MVNDIIIYNTWDGKLDENVVVNYKLTTTKHVVMPDKVQRRQVAYYNLDMIPSIGYRVRSIRGAQFRKKDCLAKINSIHSIAKKSGKKGE
jgi:probable DNA-binding protein|nr:RhuM family protein [uncultured Lachnoanaerobaculum sp.]